MSNIRECINCEHSCGGGSDVWCEHNPKGKESYMHETDCPYFKGNKWYKEPTKTIKINTQEKTCKTCTIRYKDGFCMQHCYYTSDEDSCPQWSDTELEFDFERIYRLCKQYVKLSDDYEKFKELTKEHKGLSMNMHSYEFFFNCVINDLHREMSLWKTRR